MKKNAITVSDLFLYKSRIVSEHMICDGITSKKGKKSITCYVILNEEGLPYAYFVLQVPGVMDMTAVSLKDIVHEYNKY